VVVEGVAPRDIKLAPGHYPKSQLPGQVGNFAVAGHRTPAIFWNVDQLHGGDVVVVETRTEWFVYKITKVHIIKPTKVSVVAANPEQPGSAATRKLLTLTTCNPKWDNYERLVVQAELARTQLRGTGRPAELGG
jgi:LPXTG-site transpeptidase (sortase) family protein